MNQNIPGGWEDNEGNWVWKEDDSTKNVTESSWFFFGRGLPDKPDIKYNEFGDDDCAMILDKEHFLRYLFSSHKSCFIFDF